ncbi:MAG: serine hydrolase domain-containing protein, partial [Desulfobulbia bacterium]
MHPDSIVHNLQALLDKAVDCDPEIHNGVLKIASANFEWAGATGFANSKFKIPMQTDDQFQIASITKMITASLLMKLAEKGLIDLDFGIGHYLPSTITDGLHVINGKDHGSEITTRQLLSHTSGLADFFGEGETAEPGVLPFVAEMNAHPDKMWNPLKILDWTKSNLKAHFVPGQGWYYSDTGFLLAGLIIEYLTEQKLHTAMRAYLFDPLYMNHTYTLFRESKRPSIGDRFPSQVYTGSSIYGATHSVTADWACGGLVSTTNDLTRFIRAFSNNSIFQSETTHEQMLSMSSTGETGVSYGLGVRCFNLDELQMPQMGELVGHTGFIKSFMLYWPKGNTTICGTLNQSTAKGVFSKLRPVSSLV